MKNGTTVFMCGTPKIDCATSDCKNIAVDTCTFALGGKRAGQLCGRSICSSCGGADKMCPPHQRLTERRQQPTR